MSFWNVDDCQLLKTGQDGPLVYTGVCSGQASCVSCSMFYSYWH